MHIFSFRNWGGITFSGEKLDLEEIVLKTGENLWSTEINCEPESRVWIFLIRKNWSCVFNIYFALESKIGLLITCDPYSKMWSVCFLFHSTVKQFFISAVIGWNQIVSKVIKNKQRDEIFHQMKNFITTKTGQYEMKFYSLIRSVYCTLF